MCIIFLLWAGDDSEDAAADASADERAALARARDAARAALLAVARDDVLAVSPEAFLSDDEDAPRARRLSLIHI